jgi:hypothetical protein
VTLEDRERGLDVAEERVRAGERLGHLGAHLRRRGSACRLFEQLDRPLRLAAIEGDPPQPRERGSMVFLLLRVGENLLVDPLRCLDVVQPKRDLGLGHRVDLRRLRLSPGLEVLGRDADPGSQLPQKTLGGTALSPLEPRDVARRTSWERQLPLTQAGTQAGLLKTRPHRLRRIEIVFEWGSHRMPPMSSQLHFRCSDRMRDCTSDDLRDPGVPVVEAAAAGTDAARRPLPLPRIHLR